MNTESVTHNADSSVFGRQIFSPNTSPMGVFPGCLPLGPGRFPLLFCIPGHPPLLVYDERVRGLPPRGLRAARLRYRRGGDRQATDAASDLLQRLTTTTAAPLFRASRCVRCCRCS